MREWLMRQMRVMERASRLYRLDIHDAIGLFGARYRARNPLAA
jgi:hypothetical protein